jgi:hypothetical protein
MVLTTKSFRFKLAASAPLVIKSTWDFEAGMLIITRASFWVVFSVMDNLLSDKVFDT